MHGRRSKYNPTATSLPTTHESLLSARPCHSLTTKNEPLSLHTSTTDNIFFAMPNTENGTANPIVADDDISAGAFNSEYMLDSPEGSPIPYFPANYNGSPDQLQTLESIRTAQPKSILAPGNLAVPQQTVHPFSQNGFHDSASDSSSSKLAESLASTGGDVMMGDVDIKSEFNFDDFINDDAHEDSPRDLTINPSNLQKRNSFNGDETGDSPEPFNTADTFGSFAISPGDPSFAAFYPERGQAGHDVPAPFTPNESRRRSIPYSVSAP